MGFASTILTSDNGADHAAVSVFTSFALAFVELGARLSKCHLEAGTGTRCRTNTSPFYTGSDVGRCTPRLLVAGARAASLADSAVHPEDAALQDVTLIVPRRDIDTLNVPHCFKLVLQDARPSAVLLPQYALEELRPVVPQLRSVYGNAFNSVESSHHAPKVGHSLDG